MIVQSDHGHSTEERAHFGGGSAGIYRGAKFSLFEGGIRVPAIVSWPGHLPQDEVRDQVAHGCDWLPTIAELCGVPRRRSASTARAWSAVIRSADAPTPHDVLHWQFDTSWAVRSGDWKLLHDVGRHHPPRPGRADRRATSWSTSTTTRRRRPTSRRAPRHRRAPGPAARGVVIGAIAIALPGGMASLVGWVWPTLLQSPFT